MVSDSPIDAVEILLSAECSAASTFQPINRNVEAKINMVRDEIATASSKLIPSGCSRCLFIVCLSFCTVNNAFRGRFLCRNSLHLWHNSVAGSFKTV